MDDAALVQATLKGEASAFANLVQRYQARVYNLAYRIIGPADAEDAAQESFVKAYTQLSTYKPEHKFSNWLLSITAHYCIDLVRRRKRMGAYLEALALERPVEAGPEAALVQKESRSDVQRLVATLPPSYRAVLVLHYWHDLPCAEIAQMLGLSENCVRVRLHRARHLMAARMRSAHKETEREAAFL